MSPCKRFVRYKPLIQFLIGVSKEIASTDPRNHTPTLSSPCPLFVILVEMGQAPPTPPVSANMIPYPEGIRNKEKKVIRQTFPVAGVVAALFFTACNSEPPTEIYLTVGVENMYAESLFDVSYSEAEDEEFVNIFSGLRLDYEEAEETEIVVPPDAELHFSFAATSLGDRTEYQTMVYGVDEDKYNSPSSSGLASITFFYDWDTATAEFTFQVGTKGLYRIR